MNKINIGSGWECHEGWINADNTQKPQRENYPITFMDATVTWPYDDDTFDYVLSEHMIEHIPEEKGLFMLKEAHRCLKPGGVIRIACPDRQFAEEIVGADDHPYVAAYTRKIFNREPRRGDAALISRRTLHEQGHVWVPTAAMLVNQLKKAGFQNVQHMQYGQSDHYELHNIELMDGIREWESISVEGTK